MGKIVCILAVLAAVLTTAIGCVAPARTLSSGDQARNTRQDSLEQEQTYQVIFVNTCDEPILSQWMQSMVDEFNKKEPGIQVECRVASPEAGEAMVASGNADVLFSDQALLMSLAQAGNVLSLQQRVAQWDEGKDLSSAAFLAGNLYQGELMAIPAGFSCKGVFVRRDWLEAMGYSMQSLENWTWDQYFDVIYKTTDRNSNRYGIAFCGGADGVLSFAQYAASQMNVSAWIAPDGSNLFQNTQALSLFKKFYSLYTDGYAPPPSIDWDLDETNDSFLNGQCATLNQSLRMTQDAHANMEDGTWMILPQPVNPDATRNYITFDTSYYSIASGTKNPDAAWKLVAFLSSRQVNQQYAKMRNVLPIFQDGLKMIAKDDATLRGVAEQLMDAQLQYVTLPAYLERFDEFISEYATQQVQRYMTNMQSAEETIQNLGDYLQTAHQEFTQARSQ